MKRERKKNQMINIISVSQREYPDEEVNKSFRERGRSTEMNQIMMSVLERESILMKKKSISVLE